MQLRKNVNNFNDVNYNFQLIERLLTGHGLDGDYIRELPALKISGVLQAHQVSIGNETHFAEGYDPAAVAKRAQDYIDNFKSTLGDMAYQDKVEYATLGETLVRGGYLQTVMIDAGSITTGELNANLIKARTLKADRLELGGITEDELGKRCVGSINIQLNAVGASHIAANSIQAGHIQAGAITAAKLASEIILGGTIWAGQDRVRLDNQGIRVYGENLRFYDGSSCGGGATAVGSSLSLATSGDLLLLTTSSAKSISLSVAGSVKIMVNSGEIALRQRLFAVGPYINILYDIRPYSTSTWLGTSSNKFAAGYFNNLPGCPLPTSNSGIGVMKKIKPPAIREGKQGVRHYFLDEDFPSEMKCKKADKDEKGNIIEREEEEIEYIRTLGVLVQATREIISRLETLEKEVLGYAKDPEDY